MGDCQCQCLRHWLCHKLRHRLRHRLRNGIRPSLRHRLHWTNIGKPRDVQWKDCAKPMELLSVKPHIECIGPLLHKLAQCARFNKRLQI